MARLLSAVGFQSVPLLGLRKLNRRGIFFRGRCGIKVWPLLKTHNLWITMLVWLFRYCQVSFWWSFGTEKNAFCCLYTYATSVKFSSRQSAFHHPFPVSREDLPLSLRCSRDCPPNIPDCLNQHILLISHINLALPTFMHFSGPEGKMQSATSVLRLRHSNTQISGGGFFICCDANVFKLTKEERNIDLLCFYGPLCFACERNSQHNGTRCYFKFSDKAYTAHYCRFNSRFHPRVLLLSVRFNYKCLTWVPDLALWFCCNCTCGDIIPFLSSELVFLRTNMLADPGPDPSYAAVSFVIQVPKEIQFRFCFDVQTRSFDGYIMGKEYHPHSMIQTDTFHHFSHHFILCPRLLPPRCGSAVESHSWTQEHWFGCGNSVYEVWPRDAFLRSLHPRHCFRVLVLIWGWKVKDGAPAISCVV